MKPTQDELTRTGITACFYLSGAAGLIYQVLWIRLLIPVVGAALHAVSMVLAAFMAGLALGSWLGGRWSDSSGSSALRAYALLELLIALLSGAVSWLLPLLARLPSFKLPLAFLVLLVPTLLMGATLPVLAKLVTEELGALGERVGQLYSANTSGAVVGAVAAGSLLVPLWGIRNSLLLAVGLNLLASVVAAVLPQGQAESSPEEQFESLPTPWARVTLLAFGFSGALALGFEVVWTRALSGVLGTSVYAFSTMLVVFLVGIAAGSGLMAGRVDRVERPEHLLGWLFLASGLAGLLAGISLEWLPRLLFAAGPHLGGFGSYLLLHLCLAGLVLLPQTLALGATFPVVARLVTPDLTRLGNHLGRAYFVNTVGGIAGSLLAGFWLVPLLGARGAAGLLAALGCLLGVVWLASTGRRTPALLGLVAGGVGVVLLVSKDGVRDNLYATYAGPHVLKAGSYEAHRDRVKGVEILESLQGLHCDVVVSREGETMSLSLDGWVVASTGSGDSFIQHALGHFPVLMAPNPESILVVGLGTGITASACTDLEADSVTVVELEPAVVKASSHFRPLNEGVFENPSLKIVLGDGRHFIASEQGQYDVITSDPIHPFSRGSASLYTVEHFQNCARRLKPGGLMVQWLPLYGLSKQDAQIVVASFLQAFPNASYWSWYPTGNREDGILVGGLAEVDMERLEERLKTLGPKSRWGSAGEVLSGFLMEGEALQEWVQGVPLNTDDKPILEFTAPISIYQRSQDMATRVARELLERSGTHLPRLPELRPEQMESLAEWFRRNARPAKSQRLLNNYR